MIPETDETLARLTFNARAVREFFHAAGQGLRLQLEGRAVTFRPVTTTRGADVLVLQRRPPNGLMTNIPIDPLTQRLMQRLFRAGLSESQPYFLLEAEARGWIGIEHHPSDEPPPRQPLMIVTGFEMPPPPIELVVWRRFQRALSQSKPVGTDQWQEIRAMVLGATQIATSRGRSSRRVLANSLLALVNRNMRHLLAWRERQPVMAAEVNELIERVTGEPPSSVAPLPRITRKRHSEPEADPDEPEAEVEAEVDPTATEDAAVIKPRRGRRRQTETITPWWTRLEEEPGPEPAAARAVDATEIVDEPVDEAQAESAAPAVDAAETVDEPVDETSAVDATETESETDLDHDEPVDREHIDPADDDQPPDSWPEIGYDKK